MGRGISSHVTIVGNGIKMTEVPVIGMDFAHHHAMRRFRQKKNKNSSQNNEKNAGKILIDLKEEARNSILMTNYEFLLDDVRIKSLRIFPGPTDGNWVLIGFFQQSIYFYGGVFF